jgi:hypothetical protein
VVCSSVDINMKGVTMQPSMKWWQEWLLWFLAFFTATATCVDYIGLPPLTIIALMAIVASSVYIVCASEDARSGLRTVSLYHTCFKNNSITVEKVQTATTLCMAFAFLTMGKGIHLHDGLFWFLFLVTLYFLLLFDRQLTRYRDHKDRIKDVRS